MDGYALLAELRKLRATAAAPAIALSGFTRPKDAARAVAAGFVGHLHKPLDIAELFAMAGRLFR